MRATIYTPLLYMLLMTACSGGDKMDIWYESTKNKIISDSDRPTDSLAIYKETDTKRETWTRFYKGQKVRMDLVEDDSVVGTWAFYTADDRFELRREICPNHQIAFEGIVYKGRFFGTATWWHCNGQKKLQGVRYNSEKIGIWKTWDEDGRLIKTENFGNEDLFKVIELIE